VSGRAKFLASVCSCARPFSTMQRATLDGEVLDLSRNRAWTVLQSVTGILLVRSVFALVLRFALNYRRTATVQISGSDIRVSAKTVLGGKTLREEDWHFPGLVRVVRESRYPSLPLYAGLAMFFVGTALGMIWLLDGLRAASGSLIVMGALVLALGIALDYGVSVLGARLPTRECVVLNWGDKGAALRLRASDPGALDAFYASVSAPARAGSQRDEGRAATEASASDAAHAP
jgi:hypothetical protein